MQHLHTQRNEIEKMLINRAQSDEDFRQKLISNPKATVEEVTGVRFGDDVEIEVHEENPTHLHLVLPVGFAIDGELSDDHLESVAGGGALPDMNVSGTVHLNVSTIVPPTTPPSSVTIMKFDSGAGSFTKIIPTVSSLPDPTQHLTPGALNASLIDTRKTQTELRDEANSGKSGK